MDGEPARPWVSIAARLLIVIAALLALVILAYSPDGEDAGGEGMRLGSPS